LTTSQIIDLSDEISIKTQAFFHQNINNYTVHKLLSEDNRLCSKQIAIPEQIHSEKVQYIKYPGNYNEVDGLITDNPKIVLTLKVADCVPIYLYIPDSKIFGLVHSGWRGTVNGIIENTIGIISAMTKDIKNIRVLLGPAIGFCCYEVGSEVADNFTEGAKRKIDNGKWHIGLHEEIVIQLVSMGISVDNIKTINVCTFENHQFHSYRRDGLKSGRMVAFMGMQK